MRLTASLEDDVFRWRPDDESGRVTSVVTGVDGPRFNEVWIRAVADAQGGYRHPPRGWPGGIDTVT